MHRRLFDVLGASALIICTSTVAVWLPSYFITFGWRFFSQNTAHSWTSDLETTPGGIQFRRDTRPPYSFEVVHGPRVRRSTRSEFTTTHLGFGFTSFEYHWNLGYVAWRTVVVLPFYPIALLTVAPSLFWVVSIHRRRQIRRRQRQGCCLQCGYSLIGSTSDRCPECGAVRLLTK